MEATSRAPHRPVEDGPPWNSIPPLTPAAPHRRGTHRRCGRRDRRRVPDAGHVGRPAAARTRGHRNTAADELAEQIAEAGAGEDTDVDIDSESGQVDVSTPDGDMSFGDGTELPDDFPSRDPAPGGLPAELRHEHQQRRLRGRLDDQRRAARRNRWHLRRPGRRVHRRRVGRRRPTRAARPAAAPPRPRCSTTGRGRSSCRSRSASRARPTPSATWSRRPPADPAGRTPRRSSSLLR